MQRFKSPSITGIFSTILLSLAGLSSAQAMVCVTGPPTCKAAPGAQTCSNDSTRQCDDNSDCVGPGTCVGSVLGIGGNVAANPNSISSVVLTGATNVTLTVSSLPNTYVTFRAVPTAAGVDGQAIVVATDSLGGTCTVPVSFRNRVAGPASGETVCPLAELYSLSVQSSPASPLGTTACSSHLATCKDILPPGYDFQAESRILTVRSPIAGTGVEMELTKTGTFSPSLRFMFSRSADQGKTFTAFTDITTSVLPPPPSLAPQLIRLGGTGQWSDVRAVAVQAVNPVPALGQWGMIVMILLLLTGSSVLLTRRRLAKGGSR